MKMFDRVLKTWAFHNLVAHPVSQIVIMFGCKKLSYQIHDYCLPEVLPKHKRNIQ